MYSSLVFFGACFTWVHEIFHDEIEPKEKKNKEKKNHPLLEKEKGGITKGKQPNNHNTTKKRPQ